MVSLSGHGYNDGCVSNSESPVSIDTHPSRSQTKLLFKPPRYVHCASSLRTSNAMSREAFVVVFFLDGFVVHFWISNKL